MEHTGTEERDLRGRMTASRASKDHSLDEAVRMLADSITKDYDDAREAHAVAYEVLIRLGVEKRKAAEVVKNMNQDGETANPFPADEAGGIGETDRMLERALRSSGIGYRRVRLEDAWYRDAAGILVAMLDGREPVVLVPHRLGYAWIDPVSGRKTHVRKRNASRLGDEGFCFYRPLPVRALTVADIIRYMINSLEARDVALIILALTAATALGMLLPAANAMLFGPVLSTGKKAILPNAFILLEGAAVAQALIISAKSLVLNGVGAKTARSIEAASMSRLLSLPPSFFGRYSAGELKTILDSFESVASKLQRIVMGTALSSLFSLAYLGQIFTMVPALGVPAAVILAANVAVTVAVTLAQVRVNRKSMSLSRNLSGWQNALLRAVKTIRLFGAEEYAYAAWARRYADKARLTYNGPLLVRLASALTLAVSLIGTIVIYAFSYAGNVSPSQYMAFHSAFGLLLGSFTQLGSIAGIMAQIGPLLEAAGPMLDAVPEAAGRETRLAHPTGHIALSDVTFAYEGSRRPVLDGLSLTVHPGEYVALVGASGSGKSTVMRLMLGFERPQQGTVCYDGADITALDIHDLRRHIGVVLQQPQLFKGDLYSNIVVSAPWLGEADAWRAAEAAGIADDIRAIPMGMHAMVSEDGAGFSGGQRQRIAIARALVNRPDIIMFDEATSALDNEAQRIVTESLDALGCTRIVIAHRISTIRGCDRICMLEGGRIVEEGTYDALMAAGGPFSELVKQQEL